MKKKSTKSKKLAEKMDPSEVPNVMFTKISNIIYGVRACQRCDIVVSPYFFPQGPSFNIASYIDVLEIIIKPWIDSVYNGRPCVLACRLGLVLV